MAANAAKANPEIIAEFHQSTDWLKSRIRAVRDWISDMFSPSEVVGLAIIYLCSLGMIGVAMKATVDYRRKLPPYPHTPLLYPLPGNSECASPKELKSRSITSSTNSRITSAVCSATLSLSIT